MPHAYAIICFSITHIYLKENKGNCYLWCMVFQKRAGRLVGGHTKPRTKSYGATNEEDIERSESEKEWIF